MRPCLPARLQSTGSGHKQRRNLNGFRVKSLGAPGELLDLQLEKKLQEVQQEVQQEAQQADHQRVHQEDYRDRTDLPTPGLLA